MPADFPAPPDPPRIRGPLVLLLPLVFCAFFALYFFSTGPDPFPGPPASELVSRLRLDPLRPASLDPLWGLAIRAIDRFRPADAPWAANLFSAACAAGALALFAFFFALFPYDLSVPDVTGRLDRRARRARLLGAFSAAAWLGSSIPFFVAATRSLPAAFHQLLFMAALVAMALAFRSLRAFPALLLGLFLGAGAVESATLYVLLPVFPAALFRARFAATGDGDAPPAALRTFLFLFGAAAGWAAALYALVTFLPPDAFHGSRSDIALGFLSAQGGLFTALRLSPGLVLLFALALVPAVYLFLFCPRSPGLLSLGGIATRLLLLAILCAALVNTHVSPWRYLEMYLFLVSPYALMALSAGEIAGELHLWGSQRFSSADRPSPWRPVATFLSFLAPLLFLAAAFFNRPAADATRGALATDAARGILATLREFGRDILVSSGALDDHFTLLRHWELRNADPVPPPVHAVALSRIGAPDYAKARLDEFTAAGESPFRLEGGNFIALLDGIIRADPGRAATSDFETGIRGYGFTVPAGDAIFLAASREGRDWDAFLPSLRKSWAFWQRAAEDAPAKTSLAFNLHAYLLRAASKNANDAGVLLAADGRPAEAAEAFRAAEAMRPDNVAAAYNLAALAGMPGGAPFVPDGEAAFAHAEELARDADAADLHSCATRFGYLLPVRAWTRERVWMHSGTVREEDDAFIDQAARIGLDRASRLYRLVRVAHYDDPETFQPAAVHFQALVRAGDVVGALLRLARLAIASGRTGEAADYLAEAAARGAGADELALDRALLAYACGDMPRALAGLKKLTRAGYGDLRAWLALATIAPKGSNAYRRSMEQLDRRKKDSTTLLSAAANLRIVHGELAEARADIDRWLELSPHSLAAWELLIDLDDQNQQGERLDEHLMLLLRFAPDHPYRFIRLGNEAQAVGDWERAELAWRRALRDGRWPTLLARLGEVLLRRGGKERMEEAVVLADEILQRIPDHVAGRLLRARSCLLLGRFAEARRETDAFLAFQPDSAVGRLLRARCRMEEGDLRGVADDIRFVEPLKTRLDKRDVRELRILREELVSRLRLLRAETFAKSRRFADALAEADAFLAGRPDHAAARLLRARCRLETGDLRGAGEDVRALESRKAELDEGDRQTLQTLRDEVIGRIKRLRGNKAKAP
jgi:tetratricopeptide (TPR) repeat protein